MKQTSSVRDRDCRVWPVYSGLSQTQTRVRDISCSIQICTDVSYSTTIAGKSSSMSFSNVSALGTDLGSHEWIHVSNSNADSLRFVSDKLFQLIETPSVNFCSALTSDILTCSDSFQIFQNNFCYVISDTVRDYSFAYIVVSPSPEPLFSAGNCSEQLLAASSAFSLKFFTNVSISSIHSVLFFGCVELSSTGNSSVSYSKVDSNRIGGGIAGHNNTIMFKAEHKPISFVFINSEQSFSEVPKRIEILSIVFRDGESEIISFIGSSQKQTVSSSNIRIQSDSCYSWEIISDACSAYDGFGFGFLNYSTALFDTAYRQLSWQRLPEFLINMRMQFDVVLDAECPCSIDTQLHSVSVSNAGFVENVALWQFDFDACKHWFFAEQQQLYKANQSRGGVKSYEKQKSTEQR